MQRCTVAEQWHPGCTPVEKEIDKCRADIAVSGLDDQMMSACAYMRGSGL
jgi:hypothetical protein